MRARFVNEEVLGSYPGRKNAGTVTIYKNPASIKRMSPWARAFHDQDGNFYIADEEKHFDKDIIGTMHVVLLEEVIKIDPSIKTYWNSFGEAGYFEGLCWQRLDKTNKFYLSESYVDMKHELMMNEAKRIMSLPTFFEPLGADFKLKTMHTEIKQAEYNKK